LRYSTAGPINDANFALATPVLLPFLPGTPGDPQSFTLTGLYPETAHYFCLKTADEVSNWSALSNSPSGTTPTDAVSPAAVTLAVASVSFTSVTLSWTAPGDDDMTGTAEAYDLRYSTAGPIDDANNFFAAAIQIPGVPSPQSSGTPQTFTVTGLKERTTYFFALKTADRKPNWSALSNSLSASTPLGGSFGGASPCAASIQGPASGGFLILLALLLAATRRRPA
jgi:hypothetical protein